MRADFFCYLRAMNEVCNIFLDLYNDLVTTEVNYVNAAFKLLLSMLLGGLVGWERKQKGQVAGVRTFALISMGACLAMLLSIYVPQVYLGLKNGDPGRIAAQVVTGVGFLGGGAMIQQRGSVRGLTTAAGIWVVANIGLAIGFGMYAISIFATLLILVILTYFEKWEGKAHIGQQSKVINMRVHAVLHDIEPYKAILVKHKIHLSSFYVKINYDEEVSLVSFIVLSSTQANYLSLFESLSSVLPTETITLSSEVSQ